MLFVTRVTRVTIFGEDLRVTTLELFSKDMQTTQTKRRNVAFLPHRENSLHIITEKGETIWVTM